MNKFLYLLSILGLGLVAIFLQGTLLRTILPDFLVPNLVLSITIFLAFYDNSPFGAVLVFLLGIEFDLYSGNPILIGPTAGSLVLIYGALSSISQRIYVESGFAVLVIATVSAVAQIIIFSILVYEFNVGAASSFPLSLLNCLVTGMITPFMFKVFSVIFGVKGKSLSKPVVR